MMVLKRAAFFLFLVVLIIHMNFEFSWISSWNVSRFLFKLKISTLIIMSFQSFIPLMRIVQNCWILILSLYERVTPIQGITWAAKFRLCQKRKEKVEVGGKYIIRPKGAYKTHNAFYRQLSFTTGSKQKCTTFVISFLNALNSNFE